MSLVHFFLSHYRNDKFAYKEYHLNLKNGSLYIQVIIISILIHIQKYSWGFKIISLDPSVSYIRVCYKTRFTALTF